MVGRGLNILLALAAALASVAAVPGQEEEKLMRQAFDEVLEGMAYAGVGLCIFAIVWAGFVLMAEGAEGETRRGRARNAVVMAVVGLIVVLLAKGISALIRSGIVPIMPGS